MYLFLYISVGAFNIVRIRYYALMPALLSIVETLLKLVFSVLASQDASTETIEP